VEAQRLLWVVVSSGGDGGLGGAELPGVPGLVHAAGLHHQLPYLAFGTEVGDEGLRSQVYTVILAIKSKGVSAEVIVRHVRVLQSLDSFLNGWSVSLRVEQLR